MLSSHQTLLLRADASPATGLTRLHRCIQVALAWQDLGGQATIACGDLPLRLAKKIRDQQIRLCRLAHPAGSPADANQTSELAKLLAPAWLLMDGACFDLAYRRCLALSDACQLAALEVDGREVDGRDNGEAKNPGPLAMDQSAAANAITLPLFSSEAAQDAVAFVGNKYPAATAQPAPSSSIPSVARRLLVWLAPTARPETIRDVVLQLITVSVPRTSIEVVIPAADRDARPVLEIKRMQGNVTVQLIHSAQRRLASTVPVHFAVTDDQTLESCLAGRGIPVVHIGSERELAGDQDRDFCRRLSQLIRDADRRRGLLRAHAVVSPDHAARRIARRLASQGIRLVPATVEDWSDVWRWTSHSESKAVSLSIVGGEDAKPENFAATKRAYVESLVNPICQRWIARESNGNAIAFVSLNSQSGDDSARLQLIVNPALRNRGIGTALLERIVERVFSDSTNRETTGWPFAARVNSLIVQTSARNHSAQKMATNAGFKQIAPVIVRGTVAHQFAIVRQASAAHPMMLPAKGRRSA